MSSSWNDFNDAQSQNSFDVIPKGTVARVRLTIRPGGHDDERQGWTGGYATRNATTGAVYLNGEFTIVAGPYARRKVFSLIGLYSPKGPEWANMGRSLIRGILNSAHGISDKDNSPQAQARRRIRGFADLDGLEFLARIDVGKDVNGEDKNEIRLALGPDHKDYAAHMGPMVYTPPAPPPPATPPPATAPAAQAPATPAPSPAPGAAPGARPAWAQ
jgi:hypothetical protein